MLWTTAPYSPAISAPTSPILVTCGFDCLVKFWDPTIENEPVHVLDEFEGPVINLAFPENSKYSPYDTAASDMYLAVGQGTGTISVFSKTNSIVDIA